jgi:uncharacterized protein YcbX
MASITDICRYPVKGLSAEHLEQVAVTAGEGLPLDRRFALAHGSTRFDPGAPEHLPKTRFLMLMRNERLAALETKYDEASGMLSVHRHGREVVRGDLGSPAGRAAVEQFFAAYMGEEARGAPKVVQASGHMFSDVDLKVLSMINLASVADLERVVGRPVHPLRFRANLYFEGARPWEEFGWVGKTLSAGSARLQVIDRIERCAATDVDPESGARDMTIPRTLMRGFGHVDMGVYAVVRTDGVIAVGDSVEMV